MENKTPKRAQRPQQKNQRQGFRLKNPWRAAFLLLAALVLGTGFFLGSRLFAEREPQYKKTPDIVEHSGTPVLTINSNKKQVNELIDFYLGEFQKDSDVKYDFALENEAMLSGEFKVLGFPMRFYLYFDPYVMDNGNIQLRAKSLSIGTLGLPIKEVMDMVKRSYKFPKWIDVNSKEKNIMIRLDQFRMQNGLFMKANKINLVDDEIQISLYLPKSENKTADTSTSTTEE
ncbi:YpmS family protein [Enterococcus mediterraneensis]|uniref:YpmS family protein n=1 Tax=Enterococcus mediterraneensis TaxID=2364791 RepID=UPI001F14C451|nr:YpmS family protein [Enterococcus mediterraneensis]